MKISITEKIGKLMENEKSSMVEKFFHLNFHNFVINNSKSATSEIIHKEARKNCFNNSEFLFATKYKYYNKRI